MRISSEFKMIDKQTLFQTLKEIDHTLRFMAGNGYRGFDCQAASMEKLARWGQGRAEFSETLERIRGDLGDCRRCKLARERSSIVFGEGNPGAKLVFIGEGPGFEEDQRGQPFVGAAGQLLTRRRMARRVYHQTLKRAMNKICPSALSAEGQSVRCNS